MSIRTSLRTCGSPASLILGAIALILVFVAPIVVNFDELRIPYSHTYETLTGLGQAYFYAAIVVALVAAYTSAVYTQHATNATPSTTIRPLPSLFIWWGYTCVAFLLGSIPSLVHAHSTAENYTKAIVLTLVILLVGLLFAAGVGTLIGFSPLKIPPAAIALLGALVMAIMNVLVLWFPALRRMSAASAKGAFVIDYTTQLAQVLFVLFLAVVSVGAVRYAIHSRHHNFNPILAFALVWILVVAGTYSLGEPSYAPFARTCETTQSTTLCLSNENEPARAEETQNIIRFHSLYGTDMTPVTLNDTLLHYDDDHSAPAENDYYFQVTPATEQVSSAGIALAEYYSGLTCSGTATPEENQVSSQVYSWFLARLAGKKLDPVPAETSEGPSVPQPQLADLSDADIQAALKEHGEEIRTCQGSFSMFSL